MSVPFGDGSTTPSRRGQSTVLGIVLLIGMVAAGSIGVLLVASDAISDVEQESEHDRVEGAFVELSQQMASASTNGDVPRSMNMDVGESGAIIMSDTGNIRIQGGDVDENISIGAIEYTGDDGTKIAYQSGGVFRETGSETRVVSAPPIQYDAESETLSFPIVKTRDEAELNSGDITVTHHSTNSMQNTSLVENDTVTIKVTSKYYRGWEDYFEQQGGATTVQSIEIHDEKSGTVTAEFGFQEVSDAFRTGAIYATDIEGNYDLDEDLTEKATYPALDDEIEKYVNETDPSNEDYEGENVTDLGTVTEREDLRDGIYVAEGITESGHLDFNLSDGNATLVVDGNIDANDDTITVSEYASGNDLSIYMTGDYDASNGGNTCVANEMECEENEDGTVIQLVASSESRIQFGPGGNSRFEGVIYAGGANEDWESESSCDEQICIHSNPNFYGSLVASSVYLKGGEGSIDFDYDDRLKDADLSIYPDPDALPPQLTYLNVAEHQVDVVGD
ncbi:DUF7289 family protein [Natronorubrum sp. FCH18a]|uniref:DUF7289 family protein n=1 Tax=Natronorubrum sp. FCH18a TaxID=3447018 RepID=UPI003F5147D4